MSSKAVRYWRKLSTTEFVPLATTKAGLAIECNWRGLRWCEGCDAAVSPQGGSCPFCKGSTLAPTAVAFLVSATAMPSPSCMLDDNEDLVWCPSCSELVEPDVILEASGVNEYCPQCGKYLGG